jgi:fatty-acyl-CoA synthase
MTETGGAPAAAKPEMGIEHVSTTVGQIRLGGVAAATGMQGLLAEVRTVDPVTGGLLPDGMEGELLSRGPTNAIGYWNRPEATAETFRNGWVFTGDLGRVLPDSSIVLTGRKKELIRCGGENVAPNEVEDVLTRHPDVSQAFVVGIPDVKWGEICCAWIVREAHSTITGDELIEFCRDKLAAFQAAPPRSVHLHQRPTHDADRQRQEVRVDRNGSREDGIYLMTSVGRWPTDGRRRRDVRSPHQREFGRRPPRPHPAG